MSTPFKGQYCPSNVYLRGAGEFTVYGGSKMMVMKPCEIKSNGRWYCEACDFETSMNPVSWAHTQKAVPHVMVWICQKHGPEQPGE
jgi:hypothetical protein